MMYKSANQKAVFLNLQRYTAVTSGVEASIKYAAAAAAAAGAGGLSDARGGALQVESS
jgi:hypothetical protein